MKEKLFLINQLLIERYGIPKRADEFPNPVDMLIATILSQNTNDKNSFKAYQNLKERFPNWENVISADQNEIENLIKVAGLSKQKSKAIKEFLKSLKDESGEINLNFLNNFDDKIAIEKLISFKGIGVKTASCVLLFSLGRNICPVDTHLHRVLNRIGIVKTNSPDKTFHFINENLPPEIAHSLHTNLIRLGREICKPKIPNCSVCPLEKICKFENKNFTKVEISKTKDFMLLDNI